MQGRRLVVTTALLFGLLVTIGAVCDENDIIMWEPVPKEAYDRKFHRITDAEARPLGYKVGAYIYNEQKSLCVKVTGASGRRIEIKVETEPAARLCVRNTNPESEESCVVAKELGLCDQYPAADNSTIFEFYCTGQCSESDVLFWYRFTVCPYDTYDQNEQWCANVMDDYPSTLLDLQFVPTTTTEKVVNKAIMNSVSFMFLVILNIITVALYF